MEIVELYKNGLLQLAKTQNNEIILKPPKGSEVEKENEINNNAQLINLMDKFIKSDANVFKHFLCKIILPVVIMFLSLSYGNTPITIKLMITALVVAHIILMSNSQ